MKVIRQTILNDFKQCGFMCKSRWNEIGEYEVEEEKTNKYAMVGIVLHEVMEEWGQIIYNKEFEEDYFHNLIDKKLNEVPFDLFENREELEGYRVSLHEQFNWLKEQANSREILFTEHNFFHEGLIDEIDLPITGTIDRIDGNLNEKRAILIDYKSGKPYTKKSLSTNIQAFLYSLAFYREFNFLPERFVFYFSKAKKKMTIYITPQFLQDAGLEVISIYLKMKQGEFEANCKNKFFCKNFCSEIDNCPKYKNKNSGWNALL